MADIDAGRAATARRGRRRRRLKATLYITMMATGVAVFFGGWAWTEADWVHSQESSPWIAPAMIAAGMGLSAVLSWAQGQLRREADRRRRTTA